MQETLITFETAKLALERGFDEYTNSCIGLIHKDTVYIPSEFGLQLEVHVLYGVLNNSRMDEFNSDYISQPTQSLLQKWLRDKFFIQIDVVAYYDEEQLPLHKDKIQKPKGYFFWNYYDEVFCEDKAKKFETYEEALELGLQESLKLIKTNESRED